MEVNVATSPSRRKLAVDGTGPCCSSEIIVLSSSAHLDRGCSAVRLHCPRGRGCQGRTTSLLLGVLRASSDGC